MSRSRPPDALRPFVIETGFAKFAAASALVAAGDTKILVTASVEDSVPPFLRGKGQGWITAEYSMLPGSTSPRKGRESRTRVDGRTFEIQRLIGRSLRAVCDLKALGERSIFLDCDVIQADGGTRTASITGACVALSLALGGLKEQRLLPAWPLRTGVAAVSVGKVGGEAVLDLDYAEDSAAEVDLNVVMDGEGRFIEIQGTAERAPFTEEDLRLLLAIARKGIRELFGIQQAAASGIPPSAFRYPP